MPDRKQVFDASPDEQSLSDTTAAEPATALDYQAGVERAGHVDGPASYTSVMRLALPTLVEQVFSLIIAFTDTYVAGNGTDPTLNHAASAAVGTMTYVQWFAGLMTAALGVGATAIVARSIGARRPRVANRVAGTALTAAFLVGVAIALLLWCFDRHVVAFCGLHGQAHEFGRQYLQIMVITICLQATGMIGMACLRGAGDTLRPMLITGLIAVINVIAVPALAYGKFGLPAMGIRGNALGTMIAFGISGVATMVLLVSGTARLRLRSHHFRLIPHELARILRIGLPSWAEGMLLWGGQFLIVLFIINANDAAVGALLGRSAESISGTTMAAHNAVLRIESFAFLPGFGFGIAASALVGQYLGARKPQEAARAARIANRLSFATMTLAAIPMVLFPRLLVRKVVGNDTVADLGVWPMVLAGLAQPGFSIAIIMSAGLKGAGDTVWPLLGTIAGMFLIRFPIVLFLALWLFPRMGHPEWGLIAVWIGIFLDLNSRAVVNGVVFRRGKWRQKTV